MLDRRRVLAALGLLTAGPQWAAGARRQLLAAWQHGNEQHVGLLQLSADRLVPGPALVVPTRAHGLAAESAGTVLAVARRPGDWLLRWDPWTGRKQWHWIEPDRRFNGHVVAAPSGQALWTTETDAGSGQGLVGVRDRSSLEKVDEWPTQGRDPHQLLALPQAVGRFPAGTLLVANGGIPTLPETGRVKRDLHRMDPSLVALDPRTGDVLEQWRLPDQRLSIRHLAWQPTSGRLGIALQAEHDDPAERQSAPVLAVWDGRSLVASRGQPPLQGYGGDICAQVDGGFVVSCPRADALAVFGADGHFRRAVAHPSAYALAGSQGAWWSSGREAALAMDRPQAHVLAHPSSRPTDWQFDNHWILALTA